MATKADGSPEFDEGQSYNVIAESVRDGESATKQTPFLEFKLTVTDGEMKGETVKYPLYITEGMKARIIRELALFGFDASPGADWSQLPGLVTGKEVAVTFEADSFNGQTRMKPNGLRAKSMSNEPGGVMAKIAKVMGGTVKVLTEAEQAALDDRVPF